MRAAVRLACLCAACGDHGNDKPVDAAPAADAGLSDAPGDVVLLPACGEVGATVAASSRELSRSGPQELSPAVSVAANSRGEALALWSDADGVAAARYTPGGGWGEKEEVDSRASQLRVGLDEAGNGVGVAVRDGPVMDLRRRDASGGWRPGPTLQGSFPVLGVAPGGDAMVVWRRDGGLWAIASGADGVWHEPELLEGDAFAWHVAFDGNANALVVWERYDAKLAKSIIRSRWFHRGSGWEAPETVSQLDSRDGFELAVTIAGSGDAFLVSSREHPVPNSALLYVEAFRYVAGSGWVDAPSPATLVHDVNAGSALEMALAPRGAGEAAVVWMGPRDVLGSATFTPAGGWQTAKPLTIGALTMSAAVDRQTACSVAVWRKPWPGEGFYSQLETAVLAGDVWSAPRPLAAPAHDLGPASVAFGRPGEAFIVYADELDAGYRVVALHADLAAR